MQFKKGGNMIKVLLKDGTFLTCDIYEDNKHGDSPILNYERIHCLLSGYEKEMVKFQTEMINGQFHSNNVLWYTIEHDNEYTYSYPREDGYGRDWC
jgi:hypothetical protein